MLLLHSRMCSKSQTNHGLCGHQNYTKRRCEKYLSNPRMPCEKLEYFDTLYSLCPECSGTRPPFFTRLRNKLVIAKQREGEKLSSLREDGYEIEAAPRKRESAVGEIRRFVGSIRRLKAGAGLSYEQARERERESEFCEARAREVERPVGTDGQDAAETEEGWMTSERLAEDYKTVVGADAWMRSQRLADGYRSIIGTHPFLAKSCQPRGMADVESDTTWSAVVAQALDPMMVVDRRKSGAVREGEDMKNFAQVRVVDDSRMSEEFRWFEDSSRVKDLGRLEELRWYEDLAAAEEPSIAVERRVRDFGGECSCEGSDSQALDPVEGVEWRRADQNLAQCRDGRRARACEPESWI